MNDEPPTLVLGDHEPTLVDDSRWSKAAMGRGRMAAWRALALARSWYFGIVTALCFAGLGLWVGSQHRKLESLHTELARLSDVVEVPPTPRHGRPEPPPSFPTGGLNTLSPGLVEPMQLPTEKGHALHRSKEAITQREAGAKPADAADLLIRNRLFDALHIYRRLAGTRHGETVYADVVQVLETKLKCLRRPEGSGSSCAP